MGKKLIIKGADFAINAIPGEEVVYFNDYTPEVLQGGGGAFASTYKWYMMPADVTRLGLSTHQIRLMKIYAKASGVITFGLYQLGSGGTTLNEYSYEVSEGINIIELRVPLSANTTWLPYISGNGIIPLWNNNNDDYGWSINRPGQQASSFATLRVPVSFGYYSE